MPARRKLRSEASKPAGSIRCSLDAEAARRGAELCRCSVRDVGLVEDEGEHGCTLAEGLHRGASHATHLPYGARRPHLAKLAHGLPRAGPNAKDPS